MNKTKILVLHSAAKKAVGENIYEQLEPSGMYEPRLEEVHFSFIENLEHFIRRRMPELWGFLYFSKTTIFLTKPLRKLLARFNHKDILGLLQEFQPAMVISTGAVTSAVLADLKSRGLYRGRFIVSLPGYHLHEFSAYPEADLYLCATQEQASGLIKLKISEEKIVVTGTILPERFREVLDKEKSRAKYNLLNTMPAVLLISPDANQGTMKEVFLGLLRSKKAYQVVVISNKNQKLKQELESISAPAPHPVKVLGLPEDPEVLVSAADAVVGKLSNLTLAETVVKKIPSVMVDVHPGEEVADLEYLLKHKITEYGRIPREAVFLTEQSLNQELRRRWELAYEKAVRPKSGQNLLDALLEVNDNQSGLLVKNYQDN